MHVLMWNKPMMLRCTVYLHGTCVVKKQKAKQINKTKIPRQQQRERTVLLHTPVECRCFFYSTCTCFMEMTEKRAKDTYTSVVCFIR